MLNVSFRDMVMLALMGFVAMVFLMLPHLNPPAKRDNEEPPGNVIISLRWPDNMVDDVDLWVRGPGEDKAVGFTNKTGLLFSLLRDDLGATGDVTSLNYENAYSRGIRAGEYVVNVHCYDCRAGAPISVVVEVSIKKRSSIGSIDIDKIAVIRLVIKDDNDEVTALRFLLDERGALVRGSMDRVFRPLRRSGGGFDRP